MKERNSSGSNDIDGRAPRLLGLLFALGLLASVFVPGRGDPEPIGVLDACTPALALAHPLRAGGSVEIAYLIGRQPVASLARDSCDRSPWTPTAVERPAPTRAPLALPLEVSGARQVTSGAGDVA
jgi:hypothetical protein